MTASLMLAGALFASGLAVWALRRYAHRLPQARPDGRGLHQGEVPRAGGLALWAGWLVALLTPSALPPGWMTLLVAAAAVALISFLDDLRSVPVALRLAVHFSAALAVAVLLFGGALHALVFVAIALAIVWGGNLYNFMDGSDGLAAAMGIAGFGAYALAAAHADAPWLAYALVAAACIPFLVVNRPPASMFMGDVGSVPLGFMATAAGFAGVAASTWPAWFPLLVFLPFVADATVTLAVRAFSGARVWHPHRDHYYQRLNRLGAGHAGTLAIYSAAIVACAVLALVCLVLAPDRGALALGVAVAAHLTAFACIDYHWRNHVKEQEQALKR